MSQSPNICDYEGSSYRTDFWEGQGRAYEDRVERDVLRRLLPASAQRLLEIGAGFGRLTDEYHKAGQVVLLDYSFSQLQHARQHYGDAGYLYVAADAYRLPFREGVFDAATMIRVLHHIADVPPMLAGVRRVLAPEGTFILEHANKRNLKAMLRYALRRQDWNPYTLEPVEFVALNYDFHPAYVGAMLAEAGFDLERRIPLSWLRLGLLKRTLPTGLLAALDRALQASGWLVTPSVFTRSRAAVRKAAPSTGAAPGLSLTGDAIFADPEDGSPLERDGDSLHNPATGRRYPIRDGIYVFKDLED